MASEPIRVGPDVYYSARGKPVVVMTGDTGDAARKLAAAMEKAWRGLVPLHELRHRVVRQRRHTAAVLSTERCKNKVWAYFMRYTNAGIPVLLSHPPGHVPRIARGCHPWWMNGSF